MREHLGEEFAGTVSAVTSFGLFVTLDALYVEGLVHITELGGEYYRFDEVRQELRGERIGHRATRRRARAGAGQPRRPGRPQASTSAWCAKARAIPRRPNRVANAQPTAAPSSNWRRCKGDDRAAKVAARKKPRPAAKGSAGRGGVRKAGPRTRR